MDIYLVGGAVRDRLLGYPYHERDWVVVGATPEQMINQGYRQVGKDFPVFLHPKTHEEYALARTERKTGSGYTGFSCHSAPDVTLEQDLQRRDLTINAIAESSTGALIDPYGGQRDLADRMLRHVSPAFSEDPLRVLRVARFAARYHHLGFRIADETLKLMQQITASGELEHLVAERVWQELDSALSEQSPREFIRVLRACGALQCILPELDCLFGIPQPEQHHPEVDTGEHILLALTKAVQLSSDRATRFAVLVHDLGKGLTPAEQWPRHIAHEKRGIKLIESLAQRLKVPKQYTELAKLVAGYHSHVHRALEMRPVKILELLETTDALRRPDRFEQFLLACEADARGRTGFEDRVYPQAAKIRTAFSAFKSISPQDLVKAGYNGKQLGEQLRQLRLKAIGSSMKQETK